MGEMMKALKAGINTKKIVFSGVGKTYSELEYAINKNILLINVESRSELLVIEKIGKLKKKNRHRNKIKSKYKCKNIATNFDRKKGR